MTCLPPMCKEPPPIHLEVLVLLNILGWCVWHCLVCPYLISADRGLDSTTSNYCYLFCFLELLSLVTWVQDVICDSWLVLLSLCAKNFYCCFMKCLLLLSVTVFMSFLIGLSAANLPAPFTSYAKSIFGSFDFSTLNLMHGLPYLCFFQLKLEYHQNHAMITTNASTRISLGFGFVDTRLKL